MWFGARPRGSESAALRLYCIPYAGRGGALFVPWARALAPRIEVRSVHLPGRETRIAEPSFTRMAALVTSLADAFERDVAGPFVLFGHSLGALVAFELARQLRRRGARAPLALIVSGATSPTVPNDEPHVHDGSDADLVAELRALGGTPDEVFEDPELMSLTLPIFRADVAVFETYCHTEEEPFDFPLHVFGGTGDARVHRAELLAWSGLTKGDFSLRLFDGDHYFIHPRQREVLAAVTSLVAELPRR